MADTPFAPQGRAFNSKPVKDLVGELRAVLAEDPSVDCAWLFGSVARGEAGPLSDVDVAVLLDPMIAPQDRMAIAAALVEKLERVGGRVDLVLLDEASPLLRDRVFRHGILLLERDVRRRVAFEAQAIQEYLDFQPLAAIYDRALIARAAEGRLGR
ncbi:MAG TPA: nucleotidyltransferase domain-containing protein [Thermoanaerobaculia bacterium]|nr:nucleotidyltransferase domain-containing protein [Thermoanaerobaculia bacterium]